MKNLKISTKQIVADTTNSKSAFSRDDIANIVSYARRDCSEAIAKNIKELFNHFDKQDPAVSEFVTQDST